MDYKNQVYERLFKLRVLYEYKVAVELISNF